MEPKEITHYLSHLKQIKLLVDQIHLADHYELNELKLGCQGFMWWFGKNVKKIREYAALSTPFPPIVFDINGYMLSGGHRYCAAKKRGDKTISAYIGVKKEFN